MRIGCLVACLCLFVQNLEAHTIEVLSQNYLISGGLSSGGPDFRDFYESSSSPVSATVYGDGETVFGEASGIADGLTGPGSGFLSSYAQVWGSGGASADAVMEFRAAVSGHFNLTTSGHWPGGSAGWVILTNLTDNTRLLRYGGTSIQGEHTFAGSFTYDLDALKQYRLEIHVDTPPDTAVARVDYTVTAVPEPSSAAGLAIGIALLSYRKIRRALAESSTHRLKVE
jgi:hypothetical protein